MVVGYAYVALLLALTLLSVRTLGVLRGATPWTSAGWGFTIAYDAAAIVEIVAHAHLPMHLPYLCLGVLALCFAIAGVRDEPQADPWWWPSRLAPTRAERALR